MKIPVDSALTLLHEAEYATLATHSQQMEGYPYATAVPCVVDEAHCPVFCISALAEHTKNVLADCRTSLSLVKFDGGNIQAAARITLIGDTERFEPTPEMLARYLRYQPDAEQYLSLDFLFFRLRPRRVRYIGGVGKMGWLDDLDWDQIPVFSLTEEAPLLKQASLEVPAGLHLLGIDCYGMDYESKGARVRQRFPDAPLPLKKLKEVVARMAPRLV